jgi:hypothetical protein
MLAEEQAASLAGACEATLRCNWREGSRPTDGARFAYTCPSPGHYPWQWYWDSCFTAIAWRHFDPWRSRRELQSLLAAQQSDGFIGHTIFWDTPLTGLRKYTYNVLSSTAPMTASIQPPTLAWAWRIAVGDPADDPRIARTQAWLDAHRDLDGDGLIWIVQPDESGLDASPQFDPIWGLRAHGLPGFVTLVRRNRRLGYDLRRIVSAGGPVCCEVMTNVVNSLSRMALGRPSLTPVIVDRMYDERSGLFWPLARPQRRLRRRIETWAALSPLALPDLPEAIGRRLVEEHLLDPRKFWLPVAPPSVAASERTFSAREPPRGLHVLRRYWRGPTWINSAWLIWLGLKRLEYEEEAARLVERISGAIASEGLREYYNPYTGRGMGAVNFAWSTLVMEMVRPDPRVTTSYL